MRIIQRSQWYAVGGGIALIIGVVVILLSSTVSTPVSALLLNAPTSATYVTNGAVRASAVGSDGSVYIGGDFTYVGQNTGNGMPLTLSSAVLESGFPFVNGAVDAVIHDQTDGGWYIAGNFTKVGGVTRNYLAHVTKSGSTYTVDSNWNPNPNGRVRSLFLYTGNSAIYFGGDFTTVGGQSRSYLAAVDQTDGSVESFSLDADNSVYTVSFGCSGATSTAYVGGAFTTLGGQTRKRVASFVLETGALTNFSPSVTDGAVYAAAPRCNGYTIIGGTFTDIGGTARNRLAFIQESDSSVLWYWDPQITGNAVYDVYDTGAGNCGGLWCTYIAGDFSQVGRRNATGDSTLVARNNLAVLSSSYGGVGYDGAETPNTWDPSPNGLVYGLTNFGYTIYAGGAFTTISGQTRNFVAALAGNSTGSATDWNPNVISGAASPVTALAVGMWPYTYFFVGGNFVSIGASARNRLAKIGTNGVVDASWNPNAGGTVNAMAVDSPSSTTALYVGGAFTTVGGTTRNYLAKVSTSGAGALDGTWYPNANGVVSAIAVDGSTIYTGGVFTTVNGETTRNRLAALNNTNGTASAWDPNAGGAVNVIAVSGTDVYVGGTFTTVNGATTRNRLAAFTTSSATASAWDPNANGIVSALAVSGSTVYTGGAFSTIGGTTRNYAAAIGTNGTLASWNPNGGGGTNGITALTLNSDGTTAYLGGDFTTIGGTTRNRLAAIGTSGTGTLKGWDPNMSEAVFTLNRSSSIIYAGGSFTTVGGNGRPYFAQFDPPTVTLSLSGSPVAEAAGVATITATLSAATGDDVTVNLAFSGTATLTSDYTRSGTSITITSGSTTGTMTVTAVQDALDENDETVILDIDTVSGATESGTQQVTVTITDDDAMPTVQFTTTTSSGSEGTSSVAIPVSLSAVSGKTATVEYSATSGTAVGGGVDYTLANGTLTFSAGDTSGDINLTVVADAVSEASETIVITLSSPSNATLGSQKTHTYTITDDDAGPTVSFTANASSVAESAGTATIAVGLAAVSAQTITVDYATANDTATAGVDYTAASGTLTFSPGATSQNITITVTGDASVEPNETLTVTLSNPSNASLGTATHTLTITDDDSGIVTIPSAQLGMLVSQGYLTIPGGQSATAATQATAAIALRATAATSGGTTQATIPSGAVIARSGGGVLDFTTLTFVDALSTVTHVSGTTIAAVQFGIPNVALTLSTATTFAIPVGIGREGQAHDIFRATTTDFTTSTTPLTTCTVASATCTFTTTGASYFAVVPLGAPQVTDATPPAAPIGAYATPATTAIALAWTDPSDSDLASIRVLRMQGEASVLLGTVAKGTQAHVNRDLQPGMSYTYVLQAVDQAGNRSSDVTITATTLTVAAPTLSTSPPPTRPPSATPAVVTPLAQARAKLDAILGTTARTQLPPSRQETLEHFLAYGRGGATAGLPLEERGEVLKVFINTLQRPPSSAADFAALDAIAERPTSRGIVAHLEIIRGEIKAFRALYGRLPGAGAASEEDVAADWRAVRILAYHLEASSRDIGLERRALRYLVDHALTFVFDGQSVVKSAGAPFPADALRLIIRFVRSCVYGNPTQCSAIGMGE